ncbi:MAG TPA: 1-acyl-sn-glycerol-3-phosphate acyltransferase [bacterium]|nr:1-acyl-sn-glycerol-3-phosphate acyltransferase [bacterium]
MSEEPTGESRAVRWSRRALSIPGYVLAFAAIAIAAPLAVPALAVVDLLRGARSVAARCYLVLVLYFALELIGLCAAAWVAVTVPRARRAEADFRLQCWWASRIIGGARRLFRMGLDVRGAECVAPGPVIVFLNHTSVGDTLLPAATVQVTTGMRLRYVLKRELLWDPCLDVVGQRMINAFVRRGSSDPERERAVVASLAAGLSAREGVLIYPEGTRYTPEKHAAAVAKLESGTPALAARARALTRTLPPRLGGALALLDACPEADVVIGAQRGFEGARALSDLWNGVLLGRTIELNLTRFPRIGIPADREGRVAWLFDRWAEIDAWLAAREASTGT